MKKLLILCAVVLPILATMSSCTDLLPEQKPDEGGEGTASPISFAKVEVGEDFPPVELLFGLTIGEPINVSNVKLIVDENGNIKPERELYWGEGQTAPSTFTAYFPYDASYTDKAVNVFTVKSDQSTEEKFIMSNLMTATTTASPSTRAVSLNFSNKMAGLDMWFDNRTGKTIKEVYVSSVYTAVNLDMASGECETITSNPTDVKMCKPTASGTSDYYCAIIPVQTSTLTLRVVYTDGSSQSCSLDSAIGLEPKVYSTSENPIILADEAADVSFSVTVSDWANGGGFSFVKEGDYTMEMEISEITHNSAKVTFTPSDKDAYYYFEAYNKSGLDETLKTTTPENFILSGLERYRPYNEGYYSIEEFMSLLCYKGDFSTYYIELPDETEISVIAAFFDSRGKLISKCFREDFKTLPKPAADESYAKLLGTYTLPVLDYFNSKAPLEASVIIEEDEVNETFNLSIPDLSPDTYQAVFNTDTKTLNLVNNKIGLNGYNWYFGESYGYCALRLNMLFWNSNQTVEGITISPNQDGSALTLSSSPAVPALDTLCFASEVIKNDELTSVGYYRLFLSPGNTLTKVTPVKAAPEKGLTPFRTKEAGILPKRTVKGQIHKAIR